MQLQTFIESGLAGCQSPGVQASLQKVSKIRTTSLYSLLMSSLFADAPVHLRRSMGPASQPRASAEHWTVPGTPGSRRKLLDFGWARLIGSKEGRGRTGNKHWQTTTSSPPLRDGAKLCKTGICLGMSGFQSHPHQSKKHLSSSSRRSAPCCATSSHNRFERLLTKLVGSKPQRIAFTHFVVDHSKCFG